MRKIKILTAVLVATFAVTGLTLGYQAELTYASSSSSSTSQKLECGVNGCASDGAGKAQGSKVPTNLTGTDNDPGIIKTVTNVLLFIIGAIAVIMLIIGGIKYTTSNGNPEQIKSAKNTIMYAIVGLIVALVAYAVVGFVIDQLK